MRKHLTLFVLTPVLLAALAGCGEKDKREYSVPSSLCGVSVHRDALASFLPTGKKVSVKASEPVKDANYLCEVSVDKKVRFSVEEERREPGTHPYETIRTQLHVSDAKKTADGTYAYAGRAGVGLLKCRQPGGPREDISVVVQVLNGGRPGKSAMKRFLPAYTDAYAKTRPCRDRYSSPAPVASG